MKRLAFIPLAGITGSFGLTSNFIFQEHCFPWEITVITAHTRRCGKVMILLCVSIQGGGLPWSLGLDSMDTPPRTWYWTRPPRPGTRAPPPQTRQRGRYGMGGTPLAVTQEEFLVDIYVSNVWLHRKGSQGAVFV